MLTEILGYLAALFVVLSLLMTDMKWLRCVNFVGCTLFVIYGITIAAYPVAIMNGVAMLINIYHLNKMRIAEK